MTKLTISQFTSPDDYHELEILLNSFLEGRSFFYQIQIVLQDYFDINFNEAPTQRHIQNKGFPETIQIPVEERHLIYMLQRYISKEISDIELSNWAAFIFMSDAFIPEGETEEERWQAGDELVWDILQRLITPSVFDGLNIKIAQEYFELLNSPGNNG